MKLMVKNSRKKRLSQRALASVSGLSFRTVQLIESGGHDAKISTLTSIAVALGYPPDTILLAINKIFSQPPDSVAMISERILREGEGSWKLWLFNFVDAFREHQDVAYVASPPVEGLTSKIFALIASTVEMLCDELKMPVPVWCSSVAALKEPWFVSDTEGLKASALMESPVHYRKRNIFVLENFLSRR